MVAGRRLRNFGKEIAAGGSQRGSRRRFPSWSGAASSSPAAGSPTRRSDDAALQGHRSRSSRTAPRGRYSRERFAVSADRIGACARDLPGGRFDYGRRSAAARARLGQASGERRDARNSAADLGCVRGRGRLRVACMFISNATKYLGNGYFVAKLVLICCRRLNMLIFHFVSAQGPAAVGQSTAGLPLSARLAGGISIAVVDRGGRLRALDRLYHAGRMRWPPCARLSSAVAAAVVARCVASRSSIGEDARAGAAVPATCRHEDLHGACAYAGGQYRLERQRHCHRRKGRARSRAQNRTTTGNRSSAARRRLPRPPTR